MALQGRRVTLGDLAAGLQALEPLCAAECAQREDRAEQLIPALTASIDASAELTGDGVAFTRAAREFHDLLVNYTANATVRHVIGSLVALWSSQEQTWAETMMQRGEYPHRRRRRGRSRRTGASPPRSPPGTRPAERLARAHLAATQQVVLERFEDGIVTVSAAQARQAIAASRPTRS